MFFKKSRAHSTIINICIALAELELPPYVLLWIVEFIPPLHMLSHLYKIRLIEAVTRSIRYYRVDQIGMESANSDNNDDESTGGKNCLIV